MDAGIRASYCIRGLLTGRGGQIGFTAPRNSEAAGLIPLPPPEALRTICPPVDYVEFGSAWRVRPSPALTQSLAKAWPVESATTPAARHTQGGFRAEFAHKPIDGWRVPNRELMHRVSRPSRQPVVQRCRRGYRSVAEIEAAAPTSAKLSIVCSSSSLSKGLLRYPSILKRAHS